MADGAIFAPETAREILDTVRWVRQNMRTITSGTSAPSIWSPAPVYVYNDSGAEIPAYAIMQGVATREYGGRNYIDVKKPADNYGAAGSFIFNGPRAIAIGERGVANEGPIARIKFTGSITAGSRYSPTVSQWYATADAGGPLCCLGADDLGNDIGVIHSVGPWQRKPLVRFTLGGALTTSDASKSATITDEYGPGVDNTSSSITVYNFLNSGATYKYYGDSGDAGLALWDYGDQYRIIDMECP